MSLLEWLVRLAGGVIIVASNVIFWHRMDRKFLRAPYGFGAAVGLAVGVATVLRLVGAWS